MLAYFNDRCTAEDRGYSTPCHIWQRSISRRGYGVVRLGGQNWKVHRLAYTALVGPIPENKALDHLCMVKSCCNPAHLEPVTHLENIRRAMKLLPTWGGVPQEFCGRGHRLEGANLRFRRQGRECRACRAIHRRRYRQKRTAEVKASAMNCVAGEGDKLGRRPSVMGIQTQQFTSPSSHDGRRGFNR